MFLLVKTSFKDPYPIASLNKNSKKVCLSLPSIILLPSCQVVSERSEKVRGYEVVCIKTISLLERCYKPRLPNSCCASGVNQSCSAARFSGLRPTVDEKAPTNWQGTIEPPANHTWTSRVFLFLELKRVSTSKFSRIFLKSF